MLVRIPCKTVHVTHSTHDKTSSAYFVLDPSVISGTFFENIDFSDSSTVDISIKNTIQLDKASRNAVSEVVDLLYKHLQHNLPSLSINKLVKVRVTALLLNGNLRKRS